MNSLIPKIDIRPDHWEIVRDILHKHVPDYEVWAFGSRAKWTAKNYSDLDLAVITAKPLSLDVSANLSDDFSESDLPWKVDIVDWAATQDHFREIIKRDKVVVQKAKGVVMSFDLPFVLPDGWEIKTVEQLIKDKIIEKPLDGNHGGIHPKSSDYVSKGIPFVMASDLHSGRVDLSGCKFITEKQAKTLRKGFAKTGDILISHKATIGRTAIVQQNDYPYIMLTPQVTYYRIIDDEKLSNVYLKSYFDSPFFQSLLALWAGSGSTRAYLGITGQLKLPVIVPPIDSQKFIANHVFTFNEKIELNTQTNQTLEQIAQAIFKSWFVDFDPVKAKIETLAAGGSVDDAELAAMRVISAKTLDELNSLKTSNSEAFNKLAQTAALFPAAMQDSELGEIPEGWSAGELADLIDFNPKRTLKKGTMAPYLDMKNMPTAGHLALDIYFREMGSGIKFSNGDTLVARITPCLENGKTAFVDFLDNEQVGWGSTEYIVMRSKSDNYKYFSYFMARFEPFRKFAIQSMTGTSGRQRAQAQTIQAMPFVIPPLTILEKYNELITANMELIKSHGDENKTLAELRNTLLPKLLSGEIDLTSEVVA